MTTPFILTLLVVVIAIAGAVVLLLGRVPAKRRRVMREVLDSADALEARLRAARAEITAVVGEDAEDPVRDAMREMLRQRLWLRDHGKTASFEQLTEVRITIDAARARIEQQLAQIERARAPLVR
ncbi:MAG: hypothetical protein ACREPE_07010 [Lysobacter sp.]